jgi:NhaP-type Na+/H+ and K+/H+ antiporter
MKWNLRKEAIKLATNQSQGNPSLEPGQFHAFSKYNTRCYNITDDSIFVGKKTIDIYYDYKLAIESIVRDNQTLALDTQNCIQSGDTLAITFYNDFPLDLINQIGLEINKPKGADFIEETRAYS